MEVSFSLWVPSRCCSTSAWILHLKAMVTFSHWFASKAYLHCALDEHNIDIALAGNHNNASYFALLSPCRNSGRLSRLLIAIRKCLIANPSDIR